MRLRDGGLRLPDLPVYGPLPVYPAPKDWVLLLQGDRLPTAIL